MDIRSVALVVAAAAVLMLTVLGSAVGGSWELEERNFGIGAPVRPDHTPVPAPGLGPREAAPPPMESSLDWSWVGLVGMILCVGLAALALWWLGMRLRLRRRGIPPRPTMRDVQTAPPDVAEPALPVLRRGVAEARRFLAEIAGPSDAVIAAWLALEDAATASGVRRSPSQTPTEFTLAVLDRTNADPDATAELLALYHRARFSGHPIEAADVARASRCFGRLAASWDALAAAGGRRP